MQEHVDGGGRINMGVCYEMLQNLAVDLFHGRVSPAGTHFKTLIQHSLLTPTEILHVRNSLCKVVGLGTGFSDINSVETSLLHFQVQAGHGMCYSSQQVQAELLAENSQTRALIAIRRLRSFRSHEVAHFTQAENISHEQKMKDAMQKVWAIITDEGPAISNSGPQSGWGWGHALCLSVGILRGYLERLPVAQGLTSSPNANADVVKLVSHWLDRVLKQWESHNLLPSVQLYYELMKVLRLRVLKLLVTPGTLKRATVCRVPWSHLCKSL